MNALEFCYTLQGFAELSLSKTPTAEQWTLIKEKLESGVTTFDGDETAMSPLMFTTWLRGFVEITKAEKITAKQWTVIKEHLTLVFRKVTVETVDDEPDYNDILEQIKKEADKQDPRHPWGPGGPEIHPYRKIGPGPDIYFCADQTRQLICASQ